MLYDNYYVRSASSGGAVQATQSLLQVGPCRSLIFGVSLNDYDFQRGEGGDHGSPPMIVLKCIAEIDRRGAWRRHCHGRVVRLTPEPRQAWKPRESTACPDDRHPYRLCVEKPTFPALYI